MAKLEQNSISRHFIEKYRKKHTTQFSTYAKRKMENR
jgi:hypothetical protein